MCVPVIQFDDESIKKFGILRLNLIFPHRALHTLEIDLIADYFNSFR